ncbi:MAG: hypothetical protein Q4E87_02820 [bacterium]|nr:hypothetical protein [bacterium]
MEKFKKYFFEICTIAAPIIVGNLGHTLTGAVDVLLRQNIPLTLWRQLQLQTRYFLLFLSSELAF